MVVKSSGVGIMPRKQRICLRCEGNIHVGRPNGSVHCRHCEKDLNMNNFQREAILRCKRCKHEWKIMDNIRSNNLKMYPCPECEGFKSG